MKPSVAGIVYLAGALCVLLAGCSPHGGSGSSSSPTGGPPAGAGSGLTIAVIPKGTTHAYWKSVQAGADQAAKELGVTVSFKGPLQESDRAAQIAIVQQFVSSNVNGIVLAPLDEAALVSPVKSAIDKKIPVVIIDSPLKGVAGTDFSSLVATDNVHGGQLAGDRLATLLGGKGKVVLLRYQEGSASTEGREAGFLAALKKYPNIQIISDNRYAGATQGEAQTASMQMIDTLKQADGIFTPNESSTLGMLQALRQNRIAGKVKFVGFDASDPEVAALKAGDIQALVAQNPTKMGYEGVKTCVEAIKGQKVPTNIDTGVTVIDASNISSPAIVTLLAGK